MANNTYKGFLDNTGLEYLLNNILAHKKNIKTLTINNFKYDPLGADNTNITIDAESLGTLPVASNDTLGGVKIGYSANDQKYPVELDDFNKMYVYVPWTNTNNTITVTNEGATLNWNTTTTIATVGDTNITVTMPANPDTNTTYKNATESAAGLMSAADKIKLDGIAANANNYTLPEATSGKLGGVKIGNGINVSDGTISIKTNYITDESHKNYKVQTDSSGNLFVNVPWEGGSGSGSSGITGVVKIEQGGTGATDEATARINLGITPDNIDAVPTSRTINGKALTNNITLSAADVGAAALSSLATVATSGNYNDLSGKPTIPTTMAWSSITGKPPTFTPTAHNQDWSTITGKPTFATSGSYNDLTDKPTIPPAYSLPTASDSKLGGVKIGNGININDGTISVNLTQNMITAALGYTPPTVDTNTTYSAGNYITISGSDNAISVTGLGSAAYKDASGEWAITADVAKSVAWGNISGRPTLITATSWNASTGVLQLTTV